MGITNDIFLHKNKVFFGLFISLSSFPTWKYILMIVGYYPKIPGVYLN